MPRSRVHTALAVLGLVVLSGWIAGAEPASDSHSFTADAKSEEVFRRLCDSLSQADNFRVNATMEWRRTSHGRSERTGSRYAIAVQRPNKLAAVQKKGKIGATVISNGEDLFTYLPHRESYAIEDAPADLEGLGGALAIAGGVANVPGLAFVGMLTQDDPYNALTRAAEKMEYVGTSRVGGAQCDELAVTMDGATWNVWIKSGKKPHLVRYRMRMPSEEKGAADDDGEQVRVDFKSWKIDGKMRDKYFKIKVPKKAEQFDSMMGIIASMSQHELVGEKASGVKLAVYEGGTFDLSDHKGKHIVVLDFWATWCGPCVMALPTLIEVTDTFYDRDVRFIAVNQMEDDGAIKSFLRKHDFKMTIVKDSKGKASQDYMVRGIPQTVIIDKDGRIQAIHQGYSPDLGEMLTHELETLVSGKELARAKK
jgi:peroxiredoxin